VTSWSRNASRAHPIRCREKLNFNKN
jgi:hypothetical protein